MNQPAASYSPSLSPQILPINNSDDKFFKKRIILLEIIKRKILEFKKFFTVTSASKILHNTCIVCKEEIKSMELPLADCQHRGSYCKSCLHYYAAYNIEISNRVLCPFEGCKSELKTDSPFFDSLPISVQAKYLRTQRSKSELADFTIQACPRSGCQGKVRLFNNSPIRCDTCKAQFCQHCLLPGHNGDCNIYGLRFFEETLKYRKCRKCNALIDRLPSSNRITCSCHYQFCYICGVNWQQMHLNKHDENDVVTNKAEKVGQAELRDERQIEPPDAQDEGCCQLCHKIIFYVTLIPRFVIALVLFCILFAFLPFMLLFLGFSICCLGFQFSRSYQHASPYDLAVDMCVSGIINGYSNLFSKVRKIFLYSSD